MAITHHTIKAEIVFLLISSCTYNLVTILES